jgi:hypothetical protein
MYIIGLMLRELGRLLLGAGALLAAIGAALLALSRFSGWGRLPGDIMVKRGHFTFYVPLATSLLASVILTLLVALARWLKGR